jgi:uncharacterized protein (TIGR02757 family)
VPARTNSSRNHRFLLLKESLDNLQEGYGASYLESDPLLYLHEYADPRDQEVVGFLASAFAYGQVPQILENLGRILAPLGDSVADAIRKGQISGWKRVYKGYTYRFQRSEDLIMLLWLLKRVMLSSGSIEASFLRFYSPGKDEPHPIRIALVEWVRFLREQLRSYPGWSRGENTRGIYHLLPDPASGSPCKRWNLYLRWMVRGPDGLDLGIWKSVPTHHLLLPLDTHTARICRYLRLTSRTAPSWAMAEEITQALRNLDPRDPVRYDFSIARLGILARCPKRVDRSLCDSCELTRICHAEDSRSSGTRPDRPKREFYPVSGQRGPMVP